MENSSLPSRSARKFRFESFSDSLWLGTRNRFNEQLDGTTARYTYFVPRDKAWKSLENEYPSVYKKLFMPEFSYHVSFAFFAPHSSQLPLTRFSQANSILERHLIVSDRVYTMSELRNMSAGSDLILNTVRDQLKIRIMEHDKREFSLFNFFVFFCFFFAYVLFGTENFPLFRFPGFDLHSSLVFPEEKCDASVTH